MVARCPFMQDISDDRRSRAERMFIREQQKADAPKATREYYAAQEAIVKRTQQLREERLAREARAAK